MTDIVTPTLGESVTEATVARWAKKPGEAVKKDEVLVELETDKVNLEVAAPEDGVLSAISAEEGATVTPGQVLGAIGAGAGAPAKVPETVAAQAAPAAAAKAAPPPRPAAAPEPPKAEPERPLAPSVQRIVTENSLDPAAIPGSGRDGRITKGDALAAVEMLSRPAAPKPAPAPPLVRRRNARSGCG